MTSLTVAIALTRVLQSEGVRLENHSVMGLRASLMVG